MGRRRKSTRSHDKWFNKREHSISNINRDVLHYESDLTYNSRRPSLIFDRYQPDKIKSPRVHVQWTIPSPRLPVKRKIVSRGTFSKLPSEVRFVKRLIVCAARKARREALFRSGGAGSGRRSKKIKDRVYTEDSEIKC